MELYKANNDTDIFISIIKNMNDELIDPQKLQELIDWIKNPKIEKNNNNFMRKYAECLDLYFCFIGFNQGKFQKTELKFASADQNKYCVFVVLNGDRTMCGPLYSFDNSGKWQTVFSQNDQCAKVQVEKYIEQLNHTGA